MYNKIELAEAMEKVNKAHDERVTPKIKEYEEIHNRTVYRGLGEVDCPEELLYEDFALSVFVKSKGKTNWAVRSDGMLTPLDDCTYDYIFHESEDIPTTRKEFPFEITRRKMYISFSELERIAYRMVKQGLSEAEATEIVIEEREFLR